MGLHLILLHLTTQARKGEHLHPTFRLSIVHCAILAAFTAPQGITSQHKYQPYMFGYAALSKIISICQVTLLVVRLKGTGLGPQLQKAGKALKLWNG